MATTVLILFLIKLLLYIWGDSSMGLPSADKSEPQKPLCNVFNLEINWLPYYGTSSLSHCRTRLEADGRVKVSSVIIAAQDKWNKWEDFTCRVTDLQTVQKDTSVCAENSPPTINLVEFGQSIMCVIEDFCPKPLSIKWKKDDREVRGRDWKTTENDSGSYRAVSVLDTNLTSSSPGTKYTCEVTHEGSIYRKDLSPGAQFSLKIHPPQAKDLFLNRKAVMECVITGDNQKEVEGATVSWTVGGQSPAIHDVRVGGVTQTGSSFTKTSTLTLEESTWFSGTDVICSTSRDQITTSDKISVKRGGQHPSIIIYKPDKTVSDSDMVSLICEVSNSDLTNVFIMWRVNFGQYIEGDSTNIIKKDSTSFVLSYLTVTGKQYNSETFTCVVKDANMKDSSTPPIRSTTSKDKEKCPIRPVLERP